MFLGIPLRPKISSKWSRFFFFLGGWGAQIDEKSTFRGVVDLESAQVRSLLLAMDVDFASCLGEKGEEEANFPLDETPRTPKSQWNPPNEWLKGALEAMANSSLLPLWNSSLCLGKNQENEGNSALEWPWLTKLQVPLNLAVGRLLEEGQLGCAQLVFKSLQISSPQSEPELFLLQICEEAVKRGKWPLKEVEIIRDFNFLNENDSNLVFSGQFSTSIGEVSKNDHFFISFLIERGQFCAFLSLLGVDFVFFIFWYYGVIFGFFPSVTFHHFCSIFPIAGTIWSFLFFFFSSPKPAGENPRGVL